MAHFIVDRKTWYRGNGSTGSMLLRQDRKRCCIGFVGVQCGISDEKLERRNAIGSGRIDHEPQWPEWMRVKYEPVQSVEHLPIFKAYHINDDMKITDRVREQKLIDLFTEQGDSIEFIN